MFLNNSGLANAMDQNFQVAHTELKEALEILTKALGIYVPSIRWQRINRFPGKDHVEVADCNANLGDVCMKLYSEFNMKDKLPEAR